jgi:hypothetical protein
MTSIFKNGQDAKMNPVLLPLDRSMVTVDLPVLTYASNLE